MRRVAALSCAAACLWAATAAADPAHEHHAHVAPHGGTLVVLGDEFAHLEVVVDSEQGRMTAYVLDGEAVRGIPLQRASLQIDVQPDSGPAFEIALRPVENVLTGETRRKSSQFAGRSERLKGLRGFRAEVRALEIKGRRFERVRLRVPEDHEADEGAHEERS